MSSFGPADRDRDPARSDAEAKARFLGVLNRSLSAVCRNSVWIVSPLAGGQFNAFTSPKPAIRLRVPDGPDLYLRSTIRFQYVADDRFTRGERKVSTDLYAHTVGTSDSLKPQLYSWEWSTAQAPHLHVRRGDPDYGGLGKLHLPTGRVFFEDVLRFLVTEHGVPPARDDWQDVLGEGLRKVSMFATWGGGRRP